MAVADIHPRVADLEAFALGTLADASLAEVEAHVAACPVCQERAAGVAGDSLVALLRRVHTQTTRHPDTVSETAHADTPAPVAPNGTAVTLAHTADSARPEVRSATQDGAPSATDDGTIDAVHQELIQHDRYRIVRLLGQGGMGSVYEAEHRVMRRAVALKVINRAFTSRPATVERFRREVRAAARLSHPNIVTTYDAEDAGTTLFLVMEYVEGASLARLVKERGPLPIAEACDYVRQAALGLQHAHERGMVHRDVKPDNLMLVPTSPERERGDIQPVAHAQGSYGIVKVLDFGLAALRGESGGDLTEENTVMGTPDYMAPEQAVDARSADIRADVYSLGCTLYYLLTGSVPYPAATAMLKLLAHREQPLPSIRQARPEVSPELARVVARLLAKKPEDRYQTPGAVATALEPFTRPAQPPRKRRPLAAALVAAFLAGIVLAGIVVYRIQTDRGELVITTESDDVEVVVKRGGELVEIMDAKTKKKITLRSGVYDLELKDGKGLKLDITKATLTRGETVLAKIERLPKGVPPPLNPDAKSPAEDREGEVRQIVGHSNEIHPVAFSPDGKIILTGACVDTSNSPGDCAIQLWDPATGKELRRLTGHRAGIKCAAFSRDGKRVVAGGYWPDPSVTVWDAETGQVLNRFKHSAGAPAIVYGVAFSKDGRHVFSCGTEDGPKRGSSLRMWNLETNKEEKNRFNEPASCRGLAVSHDGRLLACCFIRDAAAMRIWEIETGKLIKEFPRKKNDGEGTNGIVFSPGDSQLISGDSDFGIHLWDIQNGNDLRRFEGESGVVFAVAISRDGRRAACGNGKTVELWDLETGKRIHRFAGHSRSILGVAFSPDGRFLLSSGGADNTARLWRLPGEVSSSEPKTPLTPPQPIVTEIQLLHRVPIKGRWGFYTSTAVTNDGKFFAADLMERNDRKTAAVAVFDGNTGKELYRVPGWYGQITADGKKLAYADEKDTLHVHDLASGKPLRFLNFNASFFGYTLLPDSRHARVWTKGDLTHICDLDNGKIVHTWQSASFGPCTDDGRFLLVKPAGQEKHIAWDVQKNQPSAELAQIAKYVYVTGFLPGNKQALVTGPDEVRWIVDVADGKRTPFPDRTWPPHVRDASARLDFRITLIEDGKARYCTFDYLTGKETAAIQLPKGEKFERGDAIALSPHGSHACVETDKAVYLLRLVAKPEAPPAAKQIQALHRMPFAQRGGYCATAVAPDGKLFSASWNGASIIVWDGRNGNELYRLPEAWHCFTPDGARLVAAASDRVRVHDAATGKSLREIFLGEFPSRGVFVLPDNRHVAALTAQGNLHLGDMQTGKIRRTWPSVEAPAWTSDGSVLFVKVKGEKTYLAWDVQNDKPSADFPARLDSLPEAKLARTTHGLRYTDGKLRLWDNLHAKERAAFQLPDGEKVVPFGDPLALSMDSRYACVMTSFSVYLLRMPEMPTAEVNNEPVKAVEVLRKRWDAHVNSSVDLSPDGRLLAAGYWGVTRVWDVSTGKPIREHPGWLGGFTPDGKRLVVADKCLHVYDAENGKLIRQCTPSFTRGFWSLQVLSDGKRAIAASADKVSRLWDLDTGALLHSWPLDQKPPPPAMDTDPTYSIACRGPRKLESVEDGTVLALDRASGKEIARMSAGNFQPRNLTISRDGRFAAACAANQESDVVVWRLPEPADKAKP